MSKLIDLPPELALERMRSGAPVVDVREACEFEAGHIAGALLNPLSQFSPAAVPAGAILYCGAGVRSRHAWQACQEAGVDVQHHLAGGLGAWKRAGMPVEK